MHQISIFGPYASIFIESKAMNFWVIEDVYVYFCQHWMLVWLFHISVRTCAVNQMHGTYSLPIMFSCAFKQNMYNIQQLSSLKSKIFFLVFGVDISALHWFMLYYIFPSIWYWALKNALADMRMGSYENVHKKILIKQI